MFPVLIQGGGLVSINGYPCHPVPVTLWDNVHILDIQDLLKYAGSPESLIKAFSPFLKGITLTPSSNRLLERLEASVPPCPKFLLERHKDALFLDGHLMHPGPRPYAPTDLPVTLLEFSDALGLSLESLWAFQRTYMPGLFCCGYPGRQKAIPVFHAAILYHPFLTE